MKPDGNACKNGTEADTSQILPAYERAFPNAAGGACISEATSGTSSTSTSEVPTGTDPAYGNAPETEILLTKRA